MSEDLGEEFFVDQDGVLNFPVFVIRKEYFDMNSDRKYEALIRLKEWIESQIEQL